ncbi:F0F1 ATP synthase subunit A [Myxococcaceae bacterium GXIMD 01537]
MRKAMVLFASLMATSVLAEEGHGAAAEGEKEDVAGYILHHVSDSPEYEFEIPLSHNHITIHLPQIHIPLKAGACEPTMTDHGPAVPGLGAGCLDLSITKHTVMMWLAALLLIGSLLLGSNRDKTKLVPRGPTANIFEMLVLFVRDELAIKNIGEEEGPRYVPYLLTAFFFILFMNLLGLFPWMASATGNIAVTCGLAICTFIVTQIAGIRAAGFGGYLAHLTGGVHWALWPIMIPVEVLGLFTKPFALTIRLFANMLAGHIVIFFLLGLIFMLGHPAVAAVSVPFALGIYLLELFVAFVQAYVFTMLSALFIGMGVAMGHHHDSHGHADDPHHPHEGKNHDHGKAHFLGS